MDHKVEKSLNDQLDNFVELFRVHSSFIGCCLYGWPHIPRRMCFLLLGQLEATSSLLEVIFLLLLCVQLCLNIHEENPGLFCNASNFIINGGNFIGHIPDTNHRGMRVCRSLPVLYQLPSTQYTTPGRKSSICIWRYFGGYSWWYCQAAANISKSCYASAIHYEYRKYFRKRSSAPCTSTSPSSFYLPEQVAPRSQMLAELWLQSLHKGSCIATFLEWSSGHPGVTLVKLVENSSVFPCLIETAWG